MSKNDPIYTPITINLESIPSKSFAITKADNGSFLMWYYDPRNRIMSPGITTFSSLEETLATLAVSILDTTIDDPKIKIAMEKACQWAELYRLEFKARAYDLGGYLTSDPLEVELGSPGRIRVDKAKAKAMTGAAQQLRQALENQPKGVSLI